MKNPELDTIIERNRLLTKELGINGTPSFPLLVKSFFRAPSICTRSRKWSRGRERASNSVLLPCSNRKEEPRVQCASTESLNWIAPLRGLQNNKRDREEEYARNRKTDVNRFAGEFVG